MKYGLVLLCVLSTLTVSQAKAARCSAKLLDAVAPSAAEDTVPLVRVWKQEPLDPTFAHIGSVNGAVVWEVAEFCKRHKRLPLETELTPKLKKLDRVYNSENTNLLSEIIEEFQTYFGMEGAPKDMNEVLTIALREIPDHFAPMLSKARGAVMAYFKKHLRMPQAEALATKLNMDPAFLTILVGNPAEFWEATQKEFGVGLIDARTDLIKAFLRAAQQRDVADHRRIQSNTPEANELFAALIRGDKQLLADHLEGLFHESDLRTMLGLETPSAVGPQPLFPAPVLYAGGIAQVEAEARLHSPGSFKNFLSESRFGLDRTERARNAIVKQKGFLITSATAGIPLVEEQFALMKKMAEDLDYDILVLPTNQILEGLDERLLNDPRIHVVTNTIENSFLKVWQIPVMAKNQNPFASLDQRKQFIPGQIVLIGHPQLAHKIVPTGSNNIRETALWSPGSISQALYPYRNPIQGRTSALAKNYHSNSFLIVQKADQKAGSMGEGVRNFWHVRPVEYVDDREKGGVAGFTDMGRRYVYKEEGVEVTKQDPIALIVGDLHDRVADQRMILSYRSILEKFATLRDVYIHDPIDGFSHNHHEAKRISLLISKFRKGDLDYFKECMGLVQTTNAFLSIRPNIRVKFPDSNHSYWGRTLIDNNADTQSVVNGHFLAELTHARRILGFEDPLEYLFHYRNQYLQTLPSEIRLDLQERGIQVADPQRVKVIPYGIPDAVGPEHRPVYLNFHGHQGPNGAKGSARSHAIGSMNSIVGDSHQSVIWGGLVNVGTSTPKQIGYNNGGYSAWNNSFALVYPDGTKQLITYSSITGTYQQRSELGVLPPEAFFGDEPMKVSPTDNQLLPNAEVMDTHSWWIRMLKGEVRE